MKLCSLILLLCGITDLYMKTVCSVLSEEAFIIAKEGADFKAEVPEGALLFCHHLKLIYEITGGSISTVATPKESNTTNLIIDRSEYLIQIITAGTPSDAYKCAVKIEGKTDSIVLEGTESFKDGVVKGKMTKDGAISNVQIFIDDKTWSLADKGVKLFTDKLMQTNHNYETSNTVIIVQSVLLAIGLFITLAFVVVKIKDKLKKEGEYTNRVE
eukprot:GAHX01001139.1.p1 GENE.GAHX01001139.1~~GAHX01001139.1.p1  ORF type:complete len:214 (-),score=30.87 GAHX01001139.1:124-765(-)